MRARAAAIALVVAAAPALAQERGAQREFRDWLATCDNTRACHAIGMPAADGSFSPTLHLTREAGPAAPWRASLAFPDETAAGAGARVTLLVDGASIASFAANARAPETEAFMPLPGAARDAVLEATREGRELSIAVEPRPGGDAWSPVSLSGARAAMLWIEERQGRIGTVTSVTRRGERPASTVPEAPAAPAVPRARPAPDGPVPAAAPPEVMRLFRAIPGEGCNQEDPERGAPAIVRLDERRLLVAVSCWRGAYNFSGAYYIVEEGPRTTVRAAAFPRRFDLGARAEDAERPPNVLVNAQFDGATATIASLDKGRGIGDCGEHGEWRWTGQAFALVGFKRMPTCRGVAPDAWPTLHRARR